MGTEKQIYSWVHLTQRALKNSKMRTCPKIPHHYVTVLLLFLYFQFLPHAVESGSRESGSYKGLITCVALGKALEFPGFIKSLSTK